MSFGDYLPPLITLNSLGNSNGGPLFSDIRVFAGGLLNIAASALLHSLASAVRLPMKSTCKLVHLIHHPLARLRYLIPIFRWLFKLSAEKLPIQSLLAKGVKLRNCLAHPGLPVSIPEIKPHGPLQFGSLTRPKRVRHQEQDFCRKNVQAAVDSPPDEP